MRINGSQIIVECLVEQGVNTIFGYPGGSVLYIYDALYMNRSRIQHILTCHEQGAAHAADGYARVTGKVGVCFATSGPGATNLVTGIATAYMDSIPTIFITGNVLQDLIGKDSFQEVDIAGITTPITKHNYIVRDINKLADTIREAFYIAQSGRPGPVLIDIPKDVSTAVTEYEYKEPIAIKKSVPMDEEVLKQIAEIINSSKQPLIFAGGGVISSEASSELLEFAEKINSPVSQSVMGLGCFPQDNDLSLGMIGMHGTIASNRAVTECDCLLALGVRFSDRVLTNLKKFGAKAKIIHVDIDVSELGKNITPYLGLVANLKDFFKAITSMVSTQSHTEWLTKLNEYKNAFKAYTEETINPRSMMEALYNVSKTNDLILTTEVGQHQMWACQYFTYTKPRTLITSGGLGTMGFGTGASIGVQIANPEKVVINIAGDGSFKMNLTELATIRSNNLPIIIILVDNKTLGMVRQLQTQVCKKHYSNTSLNSYPKYDKLAMAYDFDYYEPQSQKEYVDSLQKAIAKRVPTLIHLHIDINAKVLPMITCGDVIDNFILK